MNLFVRGLSACACLFATVMFTGCDSPSQGQLNLQPRPGADVARFHVGDTVIVTFSGAPVPVDPHQETIKEDGTITLSLIGPVNAVGKTAGELQNEIYTNYVPKYYVRLTVTVGSGDRVYYVGGEVKAGGKQLYLGDTTVTKAIQSAQRTDRFCQPQQSLAHPHQHRPAHPGGLRQGP